MLKRFLSPDPTFGISLVLIRITVGLLIADQGLGIFNPEHMKGNVAWLTDIHFPLAQVMAYVGKCSELIGGILLAFGFLTRFNCFILTINMSVITFVMGDGKVFGNEQHPFLFLLLFIVFLIQGGGKWSVDNVLFKIHGPSAENTGQR
jgi:putative oxidoreductase